MSDRAVVSPTPDQLWQGVLAEAGAEQEFIDFLAAKSINRVPTFALLTKSAAEACTKIAEALITGTRMEQQTTDGLETQTHSGHKWPPNGKSATTSGMSHSPRSRRR